MITAVFKTSLKENEKRIPIHPSHIERLDGKILKQLIFERGYGIDYGYSDMQLETMGCKFASRDDLFNKANILILPKPLAADLEQMLEGQILCGWTHAVQQRDIADLAIEKKLTLIAWEEMNHVTPNSKLHTFYRNNELAGYAGVITGMTARLSNILYLGSHTYTHIHIDKSAYTQIRLPIRL